MNKGTIIYIGGFELPDKNAAAHRVIANSKVLNELGYIVKLVGVSKNLPVNNFKSYGFECFEESYPKSNFEWIKFMFNFNFLKKIIETEKPVAVIFYNYPSFKLWRLKNFCKQNKIKVYADVTEWYYSEGLNPFKIIKRIDVFLRMNYLHFKLDGLIVISDFLKNFYSAKMKNIIQIPPLVDTETNKFNLKFDEEKLNDDIIRFVYAGSPGNGSKDKVDMMLSQLANLSKKHKIRFDIVGLSKDEFIKNFNIINFDCEKYSFVFFHGRISHDDALNFVRNSNYSIIFRDNYIVNNAGFPTKFVESISSGTPVIANNTSNLSNYYYEYGNIVGFLIDNLDQISVKKCFKSILKTSKYNNIINKKKCKEIKVFDYRNFLRDFEILLKSN